MKKQPKSVSEFKKLYANKPVVKRRAVKPRSTASELELKVDRVLLKLAAIESLLNFSISAMTETLRIFRSGLTKNTPEPTPIEPPVVPAVESVNN